MQKKKGISLIALVITIIVMIILAAAVIISLNNSGVIDRANNAVKSYNEGEVNHIASLAWAEAYLNKAKTQQEFETAVNEALQNNGVDISKYIVTVTTSGVTVRLRGNTTAGWVQDGLNITKGDVTLEAGDLIQYNAGVTGYTGAWKVLGAEDGNLLIMSTTDVNSLGLYGLEGGTYNESTYTYGLLNGISRLNELCAPYGNGTGAVGARSIKVEDVDKLTEYDKTTYGGYSYNNYLTKYGNKVTFSWNATTTGKVDYTSTNGQSGTLSGKHSSGFSYVDFDTMTKTTVLVNSSGMPTLTSNYYSYMNANLEEKSQKAAEMIFGEYYQDMEGFIWYSNEYWFASPCVHIDGRVYFGLFGVAGGNLYGDVLYIADGSESCKMYGVRAVISLSPDIIIGQKDNTLGWSYTV